jgi:cytochrome c-type biogenesis protein CcmH/NrfG
MKLEMKYASAVLMPMIITFICPSLSALADNPNTQIAYLTPMVDMQHSRDVASSAYQSMQFASAVQQYQKVCQSPAANAKDYYWLGESYFHLNKYGDAAQSFERAVAIEPRLDSVKVRVVQSYLFGKQFEVAHEKCLAAMNTATDPLVRQQLNALEQSCNATARNKKLPQRHSGRVGE